MAVMAIIGAVTAVVGAATSIITTTVAGNRQAEILRVQKQTEHVRQVEAVRQGALNRLAQSRLRVLQTQASQAQMLSEARQQNKKVVFLGLTGLVVGMVALGLRRKS